MEENKTDKENVRKNPTRRLAASTEGTRKRFIFEALCMALAQENWKGASMLLRLHETKGNLEEFKPFLGGYISEGE